MSEFIGDKSNFKLLNESIDAVARYFAGSPLRDETADLRAKIQSIIANRADMNNYGYDPEITAELYHKQSFSFYESPDVRLAWLENLAKHHQKNGDFEECAKTQALIAALMAKYLRAVGEFPIQIPDEEWKRVLPNFEDEGRIPPTAVLKELKGDICGGYNTETYESKIQDAIENLRRCKNYEQCIEMYYYLLPLYRSTHDYQKEGKAHEDMAELCRHTCEELTQSTRVVPNYYRVMFYGLQFGEQFDEKEYIYKEPPNVRLVDFTRKIKQQYECMFPVEIVPNSKVLDPAALDKTKAYVQIGSVTTYTRENTHAATTSGEGGSNNNNSSNNSSSSFEAQRTIYEKHFGANIFTSEIPFVPKKNQARGDLNEQWKLRFIYMTDGMFPSVEKRLPVMRSVQEKITPVQNAIELIKDKNRSLVAELNLPKPDRKTLQMQLNGTLLACVNAGPLEICRLFLAPEAAQALDPVPTSSEINVLKSTLIELALNLGKAVELNSKLMRIDQKELQAELERAYNDFYSKVSMFCKV